MNSKNEIRDATIYNNIESSFSLFISFIISTCVISTFAIYITTPDWLNRKPEDQNLDLDSASEALQSVFGDASKKIWALGLLAAGQSSTMTGTYAGQFVMEGFLDFTLPVYQRVFITRSIAIVPALMVSFLGSQTLTSMDTFLNILQSVQLPFALIPLIKFVGNKKIMASFAVPRGQIIFASVFGFFLFVLNFFVIFQDANSVFDQWWKIALVSSLSIIYVVLIGKCIIEPVQFLKRLTKEELEDHEY